MTDIQWKGTRSDYTAKVDGYTLRAEMLSRGLWWWCCYLPDGSVGRNGHEMDGATAKHSAVVAMNGHKEGR